MIFPQCLSRILFSSPLGRSLLPSGCGGHTLKHTGKLGTEMVDLIPFQALFKIGLVQRFLRRQYVELHRTPYSELQVNTIGKRLNFITNEFGNCHTNKKDRIAVLSFNIGRIN